MSKVYHKDILRSVKKGWKRFLSIVVITVLGVTMMTGLYAACLDMYYSADQFFDKQNLFDIRILSTLGLTEEDVEALSRVDGVALAEGAYSETVHTDVGGVCKSAEMTVLSAKGLNSPYLLSGRLPANQGEIAVTQKYLDESGKALGDALTIEEDLDEDGGEIAEEAPTGTGGEAVPDDDGDPNSDIDTDIEMDLKEDAETPTFANTTYLITGVVTNPMDIQSNGMGSAFRSAAASDYVFFITAADADHDIFTAVYIVLDGTQEMDSFSDEYEHAVQAVIDNIESRIKAQREQARYDAVLTEARSKIQDAETTMNEKFAEADEKFADAWADIAKARQELVDAEATLAGEEKDAKQKIAQARSELESAKRKLADVEAQLTDGEARLAEGEAELRTGEADLAEGEKLLAEGEAELNENAQKLTEGKQRLAKERQNAEEQLADAAQQLSAAQSQLDAARAQLEAGIAQLKSSLGDAWPEDEWNALVSAAAALAAANADDAALAAGTAAESAALAGALQVRADAMNAVLTQQISQTQIGLDIANQGIAALEEQLETAAQQAAAAQASLDEKLALAGAAQTALNLETETLNSLEEGTPQYEAQLAVVAAGRRSLEEAKAAAVGAQEALEGANASVAGLTAERGAKTAEAAQLAAALEQMNAQAAQLAALPASGVQAALGMGKVNGGQQVLNAHKAAFSEQREDAFRQLAEAEAELVEGEAQITEARRTIEEKKAELEDGRAKLDDGRAELEDKKADLAEGRAKLEDGKIDLAKGEAKLNAEGADARAKIADAREEIAEGKQELADGEAELIEKEQEYAGKKDEAQQKLADAYAELDDIDLTQWYVQDRTTLESYSSLGSDLSSIETIGKVFPVLFLFVAVLMSLTTMTRMVEEERGLIGIYKALGYDGAVIYSKYILFSLMACLLGGVLGDAGGFIFLPKFIAAILEQLYSLPQFYLRFDVLYGVGGVLLFMAAIVGSTVLACHSELAHMPAALMRPKAPRAGTRVMMERIPGIWNRLSFLNKVTVRNLFRYKKRLLMTVGGIAGCTALILCGFAIKDSVADLKPKQFEHVYHYDLMAVFDEDNNDALIEQLAADSNIKDYLNLRIDSVKLVNAGGKAEKVQLMAIPDGASIEDYIRMEDLDGALVHPDDSGIFITQNAARMLGFKPGDTVSIQNMELVQRDAVLSGVVKNYLGNIVYMTQDLYESLFGGYAPNGVLAHLADTCADHAAYAETLREKDFVLSAASTAALKDEFGFDLVNAVVLLLIVMAGSLAFVVLFTLSNTNISERIRELATIKVLGFYDAEVHQYTNKETLILTGIGILVGLPVGRVLSGFLTIALNMPSIHFAVHVEPASYLISAAITFCFAIVVNWITNRTLDRINMVEALKSVE